MRNLSQGEMHLCVKNKGPGCCGLLWAAVSGGVGQEASAQRRRPSPAALKAGCAACLCGSFNTSAVLLWPRTNDSLAAITFEIGPSNVVRPPS